MKVTFLKSRANFRGGLEKYTRQLIQAFVEKGCEVTLLTTGEPPQIPKMRVHSLAPNSKLAVFHLSRFDTLCRKWLQEHPQDVIFGMERTSLQTHYRAGSGVHAIYLQRRALVDSFWKKCTFALNPLHRKVLSIEKKTFEDPNLRVLFTNSHMVKNEILTTYKTDPSKIEVVHNGVEWHKWQTPFEETFAQKRGSQIELLFIGNGYKRKGLLFLLNALAHIPEDFHLTVAGKDKNPAFFEETATRLGLQRKVSFIGSQQNLLPAYQKADILVIPSLYDPFANVTVEALAMGLYVVSSPFNGGSEVLQEFSGTVIEDLFSTESVTSALKKAFAHPKTEESARKIRESIKELDFSNQLDKIVLKTLQTI